FFVSLVATVGVGATTIWSGVDTVKNPGADAVRAACQGLGSDCPEYQDGRQKQLRTNVLIGVTAGLGVLTAVFAGVSDWAALGGGSAPVATALELGPEGGSLGLRASF
ncbi:MAG: hypothetical protein IT373_28255, partial [Polyangiaceae bacterium]|nr:hypothetical protein [Polyangiaceae bacterium]